LWASAAAGVAVPAAPLPLYKEVKRRLADALHQGIWRHGQALPPEPALAHRFGASIGTLRRAVGELVAEGILVRRQGSGTFVASHTRDVMLTRFFRIVDRDGNKRFPHSQTLSFRRATADAGSAQALRIRVGAPLLQIDALLHLDGMPVIFDRIRLPGALFPDMTKEVFSERDTTIYALYQSRYDITVVRIEESITAALADARVRTLLRLPPPAAVLRIARTAYAHRDTPVDARVRFVNTAHHRYLSVLGQH
jgi:GntR family transcriptional regulator